ncbi:DNA gyrase inhibitor YacG [Pseudomonas sp. ML96]|uniref:DNA gyrase inhibitor YacG n=1 Tax=Pseudomonas sp. ML96 TaxID=1523503 RepID=UPI0005BBE657|nr:DNA gyrase inhibitor YacG [Pseudomonas sp. ML96]
MSSTVECPTCGAPVEWGPQSSNRPFCSERCKLIDLGAWASEAHAIPGDSLEDSPFSEDLPPREH